MIMRKTKTILYVSVVSGMYSGHWWWEKPEYSKSLEHLVIIISQALGLSQEPCRQIIPQITKHSIFNSTVNHLFNIKKY